MPRPLRIVFWVVLVFAIFSTIQLTSKMIVQTITLEEGVEPLKGDVVGVKSEGVAIVTFYEAISRSHPLLRALDHHSLLTTLFSWSALLSALVYRGKVRSLWKRFGFDYDVHRLLIRMRGSSTRVKLLKILRQPRNRHQLAKELDINWKSIDGHVKALVKHGLILKPPTLENIHLGNIRFYELSEAGERALLAMEELSRFSGTC